MKNISKEKIDKVISEAINNNCLDLQNQFTEALEKIPEQKENPIARELVVVSIAQGNVMNAMKEVLYDLFLDSDEDI